MIDQVERHFMDTFGLRLQEKDDRRVVFMLVFVTCVQWCNVHCIMNMMS